jgi:dipeptidyl aminopeptidase/acylaminoacyl peptidase
LIRAVLYDARLALPIGGIMPAFPRTLVAALCAVYGLAPTLAAGSQPLSPESLERLQFVSDVQISHDGRRIAYVVTRIDRKRDAYEADVWLVDSDAAPRPLVSSPGEDSRPRWSPDGAKLAFVSARAGKPQIHVLEMRGGEAWALTQVEEGVGAFSWSPDGERIAYLARTSDPKKSDEPEPAAGRARVTERLFYRFDGAPGFTPEARAKLWVIEARRDAPKAVGPLTNGEFQPSEPTWTPDGSALVFSAVPREDRAEIDNDDEIFRVAADGSGKPEPLTDRRGPDGQPVVDPASGRIAFTGFDSPVPRSSQSQHLYVMKADGTGRRLLTAALDRNVGETLNTDSAAPRASGPRHAFFAGGREIVFAAADRGRTHVFRIPTGGGSAQSLTRELRGDVRELSVARNGRIAAIFSAPDQPYEVWSLDRPGGKWRRLTSHGRQSLEGCALVPYEEIEVESFDDRRIQGWILKPPGFDAGRKYPLILYIHGGPHTAYGESFFHEFQMLAGAGYVVLITNPRGSTSYGEEFANIIQHRYPGDDSRDLLAAVDAVIARGYIDEQRLGIAGGSGGGVLSAWTIAQTDRFAAAVVERPVTNWHGFAMGSDRSAFFVRYWFRDFPWRDSTDYLARSPVSQVDRVRTPVLVIQSEQDYRTPMDQGIQYYGALRMLGKPARLALFPTSAHGLSREGPPSQRIERLQLIRGWFDEKLRGAP